MLRSEKAQEEEEQREQSEAGLRGPSRVLGTPTLRASAAAPATNPPLQAQLRWVHAVFTSYLDCVGSTWASWQDRTKGRKGMSHWFLGYSLLSGGATDDVLVEMSEYVLILS